MTDVPTPPPDDDCPSAEEILAELRALVASLPDQEDAARALHMEQQLNRVIRRLTIPVIASLVFIAFTAWAVWTSHRAIDRSRSFQKCILTQMAEHRVTGHQVHDDILDKLGIPNEERRTLLPVRPSDETIHRLCDRFFGSEAAG